MSTIEKLANDQSLNQLFADYLTCSLYLAQSKAGKAVISKGVESALAKRLDQLTDTMISAVRRQHYLKNPTSETVRKAALHIMEQHPAGSDYYMRRLSVR